MLWKFLACAVAKHYDYYYQFLPPGNQFSPGVYRTHYPNGLMYTLAHRIWTQGPRGGVRIIWEDCQIPLGKRFGGGYKTTDPVAMKEFTFVKLAAQDYEP